MSKKCAGIISWAGEGNLGDDLLALAAARWVGEKNYEITHLTNKKFGTNWVLDIDGTIKSFIKLFVRGNIFRLIMFYAKSDAIFLAIGGALSNWNSVVAWRTIFRIFLFKTLGKRVHLLGVSCALYPQKPLYRQLIKAIKKCDSIAVRDSSSFRTLQKIVSSEKLSQIRDLVYEHVNYCKPSFNRESRTSITIGVNFVPLFYSKLWSMHQVRLAKYTESINCFLRRIKELDVCINLKIFFLHSNFDRQFFEANTDLRQIEAQIVEYDGDAEKFVNALMDCDVVVSSRFHLCVLCEKLDLPVIPVIYDRKVYEFAKTNNLLETSVNVGDGQNWVDEIFTCEELESIVMRALNAEINKQKNSDHK